MLKLKNITKDYVSGDTVVHALRGIDIEFRKNEFVAVLGPSGCGKTTLLNIVGGLDRYTDGELSVNGRNTVSFRDADWDAYRNHSIGFVFQSYNLIPHQTVLSNVELALTLSGVSKSERRRRAKEALERVGLGDQLSKKPNQMSGGQMQRVAIARALVNDPEILLADEPTGALDSENSVGVMEILKEISKDRLIIMVTHNPDLAEQYATRIVRLLDGQITSDSDPYTPAEGEGTPAPSEKTVKEKTKHTSMSFLTALSLSCNNLMTKKARTFLTSFAGSIGIIGIALILSLSTGIKLYINQVQEDTLSSYPISLQAESVDIGSIFRSTAESGRDKFDRTEEELATYVYANNMMYDFINAMNTVETTKNNLSSFKEYIETEKDDNGKLPLDDYASSIMYEFDVPLNVYVEDKEGNYVSTDAVSMMQSMMEGIVGGNAGALSGIMSSGSMSATMMTGLNVWEEMLPPSEEDDTDLLVNPLLTEQYDLIAGNWPKEYNEIVLVVDSHNQISDFVLYSLGLLTSKEMSDSFIAMEKGEEIHNDGGPWTFEEMMARNLRLVIAPDIYAYDEATGTYHDLSKTELGVTTMFTNGVELKISGIVRPNPDAVAGAISGSIGYTTALTDYIIDETSKRDIVKAQLADHDTDVITGLPFPKEEESEPTEDEIKAAVDAYLADITNAGRAALYTAIMSVPSDEYVEGAVAQMMAGLDRAALEKMIVDEYPEYSSMLADIPDDKLVEYVSKSMADRVREEYAKKIEEQLGALTTEQLAGMFDALPLNADMYKYIYENHVPLLVSKSTYDENVELLGIVDRDSPSAIYIYASTFANKDEIANVIADYNETVDEADKITYTDYVALLMSSITTILNAITYVLIAFVAVSLVVSSIMIGIITYISVLERTKEIGILRSIGASKRDVSRVFNAETLIIGFASGAIGILATLLFCIPINLIIRALTGINSLGAVLPWEGALILVVISMVLTLVAGLIPARLAAKKDPVVALRTE